MGLLAEVTEASPLGVQEPAGGDAALAGADSASSLAEEELPADESVLLGPTPGDAPSSAAGGGQAPAAQLPEPSQLMSEMISLLAPPPGFEMALTQEQKEAIPLLKQQARQGSATVSYMR